MIIFIYSLLLIVLTIYSYALVDPNLTLLQHPLWIVFREKMVYFGYYQRELSSLVYISIIILLFVFHYYFTKNSQKISLSKILFLTSTILLLSYPFLSHDFFNYMFDAKIVTFYHQNPYFHKALDYPYDSWLRFMHWTHRTYPYGPTWLLLTLIPSFLSFGKFIVNFIFFKSMFIAFYIAAVYCLNKLNKKWALFFATNPLVLIEGLISSHNDLIGVSLAIMGIYYLLQQKNYRARLLLLFSGGVKYITLPLLFLRKIDSGQARMTSFWGFRRNVGRLQNHLVYISVISLLLYLTFSFEIQPWYFIVIFALLPVYEKLVYGLNIFFFGLLLSYYPYIRLGDWNSPDKIQLKHGIIGFFLIINILYGTILRKKTVLSV